MSDNQVLPAPVFLPGEIEGEIEAFEQMPVRVIRAYLACFDEQGRQVYEVPSHVTAALVGRLRRFANGEVADLNTAFGGSVTRQRKNLLQEERDKEILWEFYNNLAAAKDGSLDDPGTAFEIAAERTAQAFAPDEVRSRSARKRTEAAPEDEDLSAGMSVDNIARIYKKYGPRRR